MVGEAKGCDKIGKGGGGFFLKDFGFETFEKPDLSSTRRQIPVLLERSEKSAEHVRPFFGWKKSCMQGRSFAALEDDV